jgi:hypothetical protein
MGLKSWVLWVDNFPKKRELVLQNHVPQQNGVLFLVDADEYLSKQIF